MSAAALASSDFPRLAKYELLEEIGHGGMATVYRARDPRLGREVAVKIIHRHLRANAEVGTRFVAEARAAAKLHHPGIVDVFDVSSEDDPERYLVVELVRGATLRKALQDHRDMPAEVGAAIVLELCEAVEHAHASSIIHRDIKPENVLLEQPDDRAAARDGLHVQRAARGTDPGVVIKITDFGIAKILDAQGVTSTGQVLGSPAHMAPEQIEGGDVDARTDVFGLGVLFYECLVGHLPFEGKNPAQVLRRVLDGAYPAADRERPSVGGRWARVLAGALAHEKEARAASAATLGEQIRAELEALGIDDPHAELTRYFAAPTAYVEAHTARLVPRLTARGEAARKAGDVWGAAADWNRALALAPDDLAVLKRIASLTSSAGRRQLARRAAAILAGSAVLGLGAFGVARAMKARAARDATTEVMTSVITPADAAVRPSAGDPAASGTPQGTPPTASVSSSSDGSPRVFKPASPGFTLAQSAATSSVPSSSPSSGNPSGPRQVRFNITPAGAKLAVDGVARPGWFRETIPLSPGSHAVEVTPIDALCCQKKSTWVDVGPAPAGQADQPLGIEIHMDLNPALVSLAASAPSGARVSCPGVGLVVAAGSSTPARLQRLEWSGECTFSAPGRPPRRGTISLKAGEARSIPWSD